MRRQIYLVALFVAAVCHVVPTTADFHGLYDYGSFDDFKAGHQYVPQLSTFEAALNKIRSLEAQGGKLAKDVSDRLSSRHPINSSLLAGHPHNLGLSKATTNNAASVSTIRRLGIFLRNVDPQPLEVASQESEGRRLDDGGNGDNGGNGNNGDNQGNGNSQGKGKGKKNKGGWSSGNTDGITNIDPVAVVTNGVNAPGTNSAPSTAALGAGFFRFGSVTLPSFVDWGITGASTFVHFDGSFCQGCWAIAVADAVSMMWLINNGKGSNPVSSQLDPSDPKYGSPTGNGGADMSPQQICDCTGVSCCSGGWPETALQYVQLNGGLSRWADYPYTANVNVSQCKSQSTRVAAQISGFESVPAGNIQAFMQAVAMVPLVTFVSSASPDFGSYTGGIYNGGCSDTADHAVLITGYGVDPVAGPYWIIKNSWGPQWGEQGYMRIVMTPGNGKCGITGSDGLYPVYYPSRSNTCQGTPNPCGSGTCFVQNFPGGLTQARCGCPSGYVENVGKWPSPSKCVRANPCDANPNPCGAGTCSSLSDGTYSCTCPASMVGGSSASGSPQCVISGGQTYTVQPTDNCSSISTAYSLIRGELERRNGWLNCSITTLTAGAVVVIGNTTVPAGSTTYVTQPGESCTTLAYGYGITVAVLKLFNPTVSCYNLQPGTNLVLPPATGMTLPSLIPPTCVNIYNIKAGDTCASVAASLSLTVASLMALNPDISCNKPLSPPTTLCVGAGTNGANSTVPQCTVYYTVKLGDNCPSIWNYGNLSMTQFFSVNPGIRCDKPHLWVGEKVCIAAPSISLIIPQGVPYVVQSGDSLTSISIQWSMRCGVSASMSNIIAANPVLFGPGGLAASGDLSPGLTLVIPCPNVGSSDSCGCGTAGPAVCGSDYAWYANSCSSRCNGAGSGYSSCTACSQSCFGRVTLPAPWGTPWGCVAGNGGWCYPQWTGSCSTWLTGCYNQCYQAQWYGTWENSNYWTCIVRCRGNC